jgi:hypothetical protein
MGARKPLTLPLLIVVASLVLARCWDSAGALSPVTPAPLSGGCAISATEPQTLSVVDNQACRGDWLRGSCTRRKSALDAVADNGEVDARSVTEAGVKADARNGRGAKAPR